MNTTYNNKCIICTKKFKSSDDSVTINKNNNNRKTTSDNNNTSKIWKIFCKYVYGINVDSHFHKIPQFCFHCINFLEKLNSLHEQLELIQSNIENIVTNINQTIVHSYTFLTFDSSNNHSMASDNKTANNNNNTTSYVCPDFSLQERLITSHDQASTVNVRVILDERIMAAERRNPHNSKTSKNQRSSIPCANNLIPQALPISLWPPNTTLNANTLDTNSISILLPATVPQQSLQQGQFDWNWKPVQSVLSPSTSLSSSTMSTNNNNNNIVDECSFNAEYAAQTIFGLTTNVKSIMTDCSSKEDDTTTSSSKLSSPYSGTETKIITTSTSSRRKSTGDKKTTAQHSSNSEVSGGTISIHAGKWPFKQLDDGQYQCCTCNSVKKTRQLLMTHLTYHRLIDMKKWSCKICGKCFCRQREVIRHEKTHNGSCTTSSPLPLSKITETGNQSEFLYEGTWPFEKLEDNSFRCNTCGCRKEKKAGMLSHLRWVHHLKQNKQTP